MGGEGAFGLNVRLLESADGSHRGGDVAEHVGLPVSIRVQRVARLLPLDLQYDERASAKSPIPAGNSGIRCACRHALLALPCSSAR